MEGLSPRPLDAQKGQVRQEVLVAVAALADNPDAGDMRGLAQLLDGGNGWGVLQGGERLDITNLHETIALGFESRKNIRRRRPVANPTNRVRDGHGGVS